jgi:hypothetical protein
MGIGIDLYFFMEFLQEWGSGYPSWRSDFTSQAHFIFPKDAVTRGVQKGSGLFSLMGDKRLQFQYKVRNGFLKESSFSATILCFKA